MNHPLSRAGIFASILGLFALCPDAARAQCGSQWTHHQISSPPPMGALVNGSETWDPDGAGPATQVLVIAGSFRSVDGVSVSGVAAYDWIAQSWSAFGAGLAHEVTALVEAPNGDLVAGGFALPLGRVDVWNGSTWNALPTTNGGISSVAVLPNGDIVAGGSFTTAGGVGAIDLARWDGNSWNSMGAGPRGTVRTLFVRPNGDLVAASLFASAGDPIPSGIASWDGVSWTEIGIGPNSSSLGVSSFKYLKNGDLAATGAFLWTATGVVHTIAIWDGTDWNQLGAGIAEPTVAVTEMPNGDIIAAGAITSAGGGSVTNIARWDGNAWFSIGAGLGLGVLDQVLTLTATPEGLLFAGGFFPAPGGGTNTNLARFDLGCLNPGPGTLFCTAKSALVCGAANISATGSPSATASSGFVIDAQPVRGCRAGLLLYSNQPVQPGNSFGGPGNGVLCLLGSGLRRAGPIESGGTSPQFCDGVLSIDMNEFHSLNWTATGCNPAPGQNNPAGFLNNMGTTVRAQMWARDSTSTGQVLSNGLAWNIGP